MQTTRTARKIQNLEPWKVVSLLKKGWNGIVTLPILRILVVGKRKALYLAVIVNNNDFMIFNIVLCR